MNYGDLKAKVQSRLNRRDVTPTLIDDFTQDALRKMQRLLRVPAMERTVLYTVPLDGTFTTYPIPGDYLKHVSISVDGGANLSRRSMTEVTAFARWTGSPGVDASPTVGVPRMFCRDGATFILGPTPQPGSVIRHTYLGDFTELAQDTDSNWVTDICSDILIAGALSFACEHFVDPRAATFETRFTDGIIDLNNLAIDDELTNAQVEPASHFADYWYENEW
jgi:hypothetical protein